METVHNHAEDLSQNSLSDPDIWDRLIEYRKEVQWGNILAQVEELESKFDRSKTWEKFVNEPVVDQYGQVWMIWKSGDCYQIYKMPDDKDEFDYVFIDDLEVTPPILGEPIYKFSVGFDNFGETEIINVFTSNGKIEDCHFYSWEKQLWERHEKWAKRYRKSTYDSMGDLESFYRKYEEMQGGSFSAEKKLKEIYYRRKRIQRKLGAASIENLTIAA